MGLARNIATVGCGVLSVAALAACGDAKVGTGASHPSAAPSTAASTLVAGTTAPGAAAKGGASSAVGAKGAGATREIADPQEARSFPAPASVKHAAAAAPKKAGEAIVAAGAPSDAEVRRELSQMQAVEKSAKQARAARLTPVPGGQSIGGSGALPIPTGVPEVIQKVSRAPTRSPTSPTSSVAATPRSSTTPTTAPARSATRSPPAAC
jgi:hypothetical protein